MAIDIYIPFAAGSRTDELRYCLRSVQQYMRNVGQVHLITTDRIPSLQGIKYHDFEDDYRGGQKEWNIYNKIAYATDGTNKNFLFMNDDHFLLRDYDAENFPNYYDGTLLDKIRSLNEGNPYQHTLQNTAHAIGYEYKYFDIHCPMVMDANVLPFMGMPFLNYGYCFKTMYAYMACVTDGVQIEDCKTSNDIPYCDWFSTYDNIDLRILQEIYPNKSKWEL